MSNVTIGPKIKEFRKKRKLTQDQLADSLGYSGKSVISHIEKGDADMTYEKMSLLLKKYKADANELFSTKYKAVPLEEKAPQEKQKGVAIYIHGMHGNAKEANSFAFLKDKYDVKGLSYQDGNPWELKEAIQGEFEKLSKGYDEVIIIANSIGAFYAYEYLSDYKIKKAFFISPIVNMLQTIIDLMTVYGIKDKELKKEKLIELDNGAVLSYDFYQHVSNDDDHWNVPTEILYGEYDQSVYILSVVEFLVSHPLTKLTIKADGEHYFHTKEDKKFIKNWILKNI